MKGLILHWHGFPSVQPYLLLGSTTIVSSSYFLFLALVYSSFLPSFLDRVSCLQHCSMPGCCLPLYSWLAAVVAFDCMMATAAGSKASKQFYTVNSQKGCHSCLSNIASIRGHWDSITLSALLTLIKWIVFDQLCNMWPNFVKKNKN